LNVLALDAHLFLEFRSHLANSIARKNVVLRQSNRDSRKQILIIGLLGKMQTVKSVVLKIADSIHLTKPSTLNDQNNGTLLTPITDENISDETAKRLTLRIAIITHSTSSK
jgi:hypothetical protein